MTDEDDQRMDRARRIRRMREGRHGDDADSARRNGDDGTASNGSEQTTDESAGGATTVTEQASDSEWFDDETTATTGETTDDADSATVAAAEAAAAAVESDTTGTAGSPDDSANGAAAAAAAAMEFEREESLEELQANAEAATEEDTAAESESEEEVRVLEFQLGEERYCLDIMYVEEIVKEEHITRVPNTPSFVRGVVDLRGQITTILDPKESIGIEGENDDDEQLIVVFDGDTFDDQGHTGWLVDEVRQVTPVVQSEVKESPIDQKYVNGVIEREEEFVIWTKPEIALAEADAETEVDAES